LRVRLQKQRETNKFLEKSGNPSNLYPLMKTSFVLHAFWVVTLSALLGFSAPLFGEDTDMLNKAFNLVHAAWNPAGETPSNADRTDLLTKALKLAQDAPQHNVRGHRVKAVLDIKAALSELQKGDPDNKAKEYIHDADSELRTALSMAD